MYTVLRILHTVRDREQCEPVLALNLRSSTNAGMVSVVATAHARTSLSPLGRRRRQRRLVNEIP